MIGIILLDKHNRYLVDGKLPKRPEHDKELLTTMVSNMLVSLPAFKELPPYLLKAYNSTKPCDTGLLGYKIPEIGASDIILVNRSDDDAEFSGGDKTFRLDDFVKLDTVEVWIKKERLK